VRRYASDDDPFGAATDLTFCLKPIKLFLQTSEQVATEKPAKTSEGPIPVDRPFE